MSKVRGVTSQRSEGSGHNEVDYNSLKVQFKTIYTIELECIQNGVYLGGPSLSASRFICIYFYYAVVFRDTLLSIKINKGNQPINIAVYQLEFESASLHLL